MTLSNFPQTPSDTLISFRYLLPKGFWILFDTFSLRSASDNFRLRSQTLISSLASSSVSDSEKLSLRLMIYLQTDIVSFSFLSSKSSENSKWPISGDRYHFRTELVLWRGSQKSQWSQWSQRSEPTFFEPSPSSQTSPDYIRASSGVFWGLLGLSTWVPAMVSLQHVHRTLFSL